MEEFMSSISSFKPTISFLNPKVSLLTILCGSLGLFCYNGIVEAKNSTFNGPVELSGQEFQELNINGPSTLHAIKADSLDVKGPLEFIKLKINGKTEVNGPSRGNDGEFGALVVHGPFEVTKFVADSLSVDGPVALEDFKITGNVSINGPLKAKVGSFNDINTVNTPVALYDVNVNNITVKKDSGKISNDAVNNEGYGKNNEVKLAGKTVVSGNITFESGDGIVYIRDKTAQLKGKVIGGKVKQD